MVKTGHWYLLRIKTRRHKKVLKLLSRHGFEYFMPLCRRKTGWLSWRKYVDIPLFEFFVFVRLSNFEMSKIKLCNPLLTFVYWHEYPAVVNHKEIDILKRFVDDFDVIEVEKTRVRDASVTEEIFVHVNEKDETIAGELPSIGYRVIACLNNKRAIHIESDRSVTYSLNELTVHT